MIQERSTPTKTMFTIIWFSMLTACIIYYIVAMILPTTLDDANPSTLSMINIMIIVGIITGLVGTYLLGRKTTPVDYEKSGDYIMRAQGFFIAGIACYEAIAIYGLVLRFIGLLNIHTWFIAMAFVLLLIAGTRIGPIFSHYNNLKDMEDTGTIELWE